MGNYDEQVTFKILQTFNSLPAEELCYDIFPLDKCFACRETHSFVGELTNCAETDCDKMYHKQCLSIVSHSKDKRLCPLHYCTVCGPRTKAKNKDKLYTCKRCPTALHAECLMAGVTIEQNSTNFTCPKHSRNEPIEHFNFCRECGGKNNLLSCAFCPASVHKKCLLGELPKNYVCEFCRKHNFIQYEHIVWAKRKKFCWWPAKVLKPDVVPIIPQLKDIVPDYGSFLVKFYNSEQYVWMKSYQTHPFFDNRPIVSSSLKERLTFYSFPQLDTAIKMALADEEERLLNRKPVGMERGSKPKYKHILVNKHVRCAPPANLDDSLCACCCDENALNPCGFLTDCVNRATYTECSPELCNAGGNCKNQDFKSRLYPLLRSFKTKDKGYGLKCLEDIKKGQFVIEYVGEVIEEEEFEKRVEQDKANNDTTFYFCKLDDNRIVDPKYKGNLGRFINHSCNPNCEMQKWIVDGDYRLGIFAKINIPANSEITFNYECHSLYPKGAECRCGSIGCIGVIGTKTQMPRSKKGAESIADITPKSKMIKGAELMKYATDKNHLGEKKNVQEEKIDASDAKKIDKTKKNIKVERKIAQIKLKNLNNSKKINKFEKKRATVQLINTMDKRRNGKGKEKTINVKKKNTQNESKDVPCENESADKQNNLDCSLKIPPSFEKEDFSTKKRKIDTGEIQFSSGESSTINIETPTSKKQRTKKLNKNKSTDKAEKDIHKDEKKKANKGKEISKIKIKNAKIINDIKRMENKKTTVKDEQKYIQIVEQNLSVGKISQNKKKNPQNSKKSVSEKNNPDTSLEFPILLQKTIPNYVEKIENSNKNNKIDINEVEFSSAESSKGTAISENKKPKKSSHSSEKIEHSLNKNSNITNIKAITSANKTNAKSSHNAVRAEHSATEKNNTMWTNPSILGKTLTFPHQTAKYSGRKRKVNTIEKDQFSKVKCTLARGDKTASIESTSDKKKVKLSSHCNEKVMDMQVKNTVGRPKKKTLPDSNGEKIINIIGDDENKNEPIIQETNRPNESTRRIQKKNPRYFNNYTKLGLISRKVMMGSKKTMIGSIPDEKEPKQSDEKGVDQEYPVVQQNQVTSPVNSDKTSKRKRKINDVIDNQNKKYSIAEITLHKKESVKDVTNLITESSTSENKIPKKLCHSSVKIQTSVAGNCDITNDNPLTSESNIRPLQCEVKTEQASSSKNNVMSLNPFVVVGRLTRPIETVTHSNGEHRIDNFENNFGEVLCSSNGGNKTDSIESTLDKIEQKLSSYFKEQFCDIGSKYSIIQPKTMAFPVKEVKDSNRNIELDGVKNEDKNEPIHKTSPSREFRNHLRKKNSKYFNNFMKSGIKPKKEVKVRKQSIEGNKKAEIKSVSDIKPKESLNTSHKICDIQPNPPVGMRQFMKSVRNSDENRKIDSVGHNEGANESLIEVKSDIIPKEELKVRKESFEDNKIAKIKSVSDIKPNRSLHLHHAQSKPPEGLWQFMRLIENVQNSNEKREVDSVGDNQNINKSTIGNSLHKEEIMKNDISLPKESILKNKIPKKSSHASGKILHSSTDDCNMPNIDKLASESKTDAKPSQMQAEHASSEKNDDISMNPFVLLERLTFPIEIVENTNRKLDAIENNHLNEGCSSPAVNNTDAIESTSGKKRPKVSSHSNKKLCDRQTKYSIDHGKKTFPVKKVEDSDGKEEVNSVENIENKNGCTIEEICQSTERGKRTQKKNPRYFNNYMKSGFIK